MSRNRLAVFVTGATVLLGLVSSVGCGNSRSNIATVQAADNPAAKTVTIPVEGMSCAACAARVKKTLKEMPGVEAVQLNLEHRNAEVTYIEGQQSPDRLVSAINKLGYKAGTPTTAVTKVVRVPIEGMSCEAMCTPTVKKAVAALDGVSKVDVTLKPGNARMEYAPGKTSPEKMVSVINGLGFKAGPPKVEPQ
jgi:Cu+-exporting ATPase